jgi:hypothetical protein
VEVDPPAHQEKGYQRTDDGQQDETSEKPAIVSFPLDIERPVIDGIVARHRFFLIESTAASPKAVCPPGRWLGAGGIEIREKIKGAKTEAIDLAGNSYQETCHNRRIRPDGLKTKEIPAFPVFPGSGPFRVEADRCNLHDDMGWIPNFSLGPRRD